MTFRAPENQFYSVNLNLLAKELNRTNVLSDDFKRDIWLYAEGAELDGALRGQGDYDTLKDRLVKHGMGDNLKWPGKDKIT